MSAHEQSRAGKQIVALAAEEFGVLCDVDSSYKNFERSLHELCELYKKHRGKSHTRAMALAQAKSRASSEVRQVFKACMATAMLRWTSFHRGEINRRATRARCRRPAA